MRVHTHTHAYATTLGARLKSDLVVPPTSRNDLAGGSKSVGRRRGRRRTEHFNNAREHEYKNRDSTLPEMIWQGVAQNLATKLECLSLLSELTKGMGHFCSIFILPPVIFFCVLGWIFFVSCFDFSSPATTKKIGGRHHFSLETVQDAFFYTFFDAFFRKIPKSEFFKNGGLNFGPKPLGKLRFGRNSKRAYRAFKARHFSI